MKKPKNRRRSLDPATRLLLRQTLIGFGLTILLSCVLITVWHVTRLSALTITSIEVTGGDTVDHAEVREVVEAALAGTYVQLVPRRFAWLYPASTIHDQLADLPRVSSITLQRTDGRTLRIELTEYQPYALWCEYEDGDTCLFVSREGYAFAAAPSLRGGAFVRLYSAEHLPAIGEYILPSEMVDDLWWLLGAVPQVSELVPMAVILGPGPRAVISLTRGGELRITFDQDVTATIHYLQALVGSEEFIHLQDEPFQYIDMRFGNRLFVNEEIPLTALDTATTTTALLDPIYISGEGAPTTSISVPTGPPQVPQPTPQAVIDAEFNPLRDGEEAELVVPIVEEADVAESVEE